MIARIQSAARGSSKAVIACTLGIGLLFTAACTSTSTDAASSTSSVAASGTAQDTASSSAATAASQMTSPAESYDPTPVVPSDGAPASAAGPSADAVTPAAPVSTSGPVPTTGDINQTVPAVDLPTNPAVPLDGTGDFGDQVVARLSEVKNIDATARVPGEISGPALSVTVEVENNGTAAIGLDSVSVNLTGKNGDPASPLTTEPANPLSGVLNPGEKRSGVYVFTIAADARDDVAVTVLYSVGAPIVLFQGNAAGS